MDTLFANHVFVEEDAIKQQGVVEKGLSQRCLLGFAVYSRSHLFWIPTIQLSDYLLTRSNCRKRHKAGIVFRVRVFPLWARVVDRSFPVADFVFIADPKENGTVSEVYEDVNDTISLAGNRWGLKVKEANTHIR